MGRRRPYPRAVPEGDTIHRAAARLRPVLVGRVATRVEVPRWSGPVPAPDETIDAVRAHGKHLLVDFSGGLTLRTHLRMTGRWELYGVAESWRRPRSSARVVIEVPDRVAVCFSAPDVSFVRRERVATTHLGPDLCEETPDLEAIVARVARFATARTEIGELLLDQRVAAGIGNVYKSETLFLCGVPPRALVRDLEDAALDRLIAAAQRLLRRNLGPGPRRTTSAVSPTRTWAYGRTGSPCHRCLTPIRRLVQGDPPRSTWFCPRCQGGAGSGAHE